MVYKTLSLIILLLSCNKMNKFQMLSGHKMGTALFNNAKAIFDGNSLTAGGYPVYVQNAFIADSLNVNCVNIGVGGQTTAQMDADAPTQIDPNWIAGKTNLLVAYEIGNDLYFNGNVQDACNRFAQYCLNRKSAANANGVDLRIVVVTCTPRFNVSDTLLVPANDWLKLNYHLFADKIVDLRSDNSLLDIDDTLYYSDRVHYTDLGNQIVAQLVYNVIKTF